MVGRAARVGHVRRRVLRSGICLGVVVCVGFAASAARSESLPEALAKAYQTNPQLNAERARQRATDENVPQALAGYRPQIVASLSARAAGGARPAAGQHVPVGDPETVDHRGDGDADPVQRFQDRQQRPRRGVAGAGRPRSPAQCRPGRAARRRHRLYQRAGQSVAGRGAARQRRVPAGNPGHRPEAPQCRRRDADRYRAGRGAAQPRAARISMPPRSTSPSARRPMPR